MGQVVQHLLEVETEVGEDLVELSHKQNLEVVPHCWAEAMLMAEKVAESDFHVDYFGIPHLAVLQKEAVLNLVVNMEAKEAVLNFVVKMEAAKEAVPNLDG